jgi:hypothetical protein
MKFKRVLVLAAGLGLIGMAQHFLPASLLSASTPAKPITEQQVKQWINAKAEDPINTESFTFQQVQLDEDDAMEIVAKHNGSVHIGSFYILDHQANGSYSLIAEKPWNVPSFQLERWDITRYEDDSDWNSRDAKELGKVADKRLFETINHSGGSGVHVSYSHLWYLENGKLVEAWSGTLEETVSIPGGQQIQTVGSYQLVQAYSKTPLLYTWQTQQELDPESGKPLSNKMETTTELFYFENGVFQKQPK